VRAINSVLEQSYSNIEIIVIDDGSTDNTRELIRDLYAGDQRLIYLNQANTGVASARNAGFAIANGDFVALLDSDDMWMPWKLELQIACLQRFPEVGMVWSDMEAVNSDGNVFEPRYIRKMYSGYQVFAINELFTGQYKLKDLSSLAPSIAEKFGEESFYTGYIFSQMVMGSLVHTSTVVLRRERLTKVGGFNEDLRYSGEDFDFHLRVCREGLVGFVDLPTIQYQQGMSDALTRPEYTLHIVNNFLKTILPIIENDRTAIKLPDSMIRAVLADAYSWRAEAQVNIGETKAARKSVWTSLRYKIWQPHILRTLVSAYLPKSILSLLRAIKRRVSGRAVAQP
jgi:glycosyltransferase involved in cell wall biosynthesis